MIRAAESRHASKPLLVPVTALVLGAVMFLAAWLGAGEPVMGLVMLGIMLTYAAVMRFGQRFETVQILGNDPPLDERHAQIQLRAVAMAYYMVLVVALAGALWEVSQSRPGAFTLVCTVGGLTHMISAMVLRRRV